MLHNNQLWKMKVYRTAGPQEGFTKLFYQVINDSVSGIKAFQRNEKMLRNASWGWIETWAAELPILIGQSWWCVAFLRLDLSRYRELLRKAPQGRREGNIYLLGRPEPVRKWGFRDERAGWKSQRAHSDAKWCKGHPGRRASVWEWICTPGPFFNTAQPSSTQISSPIGRDWLLKHS